MKHIRMPRAHWKKWKAALLSGDYKKGRDSLYDQSTDSYCCLGVLQHCLSNKVEREDDGRPFNVPSFGWLKKHNIEFYSNPFTCKAVVPYIDSMEQGIAELNDMTVYKNSSAVDKYTFKDIAGFLEEEVEFTDA